MNQYFVHFRDALGPTQTVGELTFDEMLGTIASLTIPISANEPLYRADKLFLAPPDETKHPNQEGDGLPEP